jgi:uncharacterized protein YjiS (DUF1127 family)
MLMSLTCPDTNAQRSLASGRPFRSFGRFATAFALRCSRISETMQLWLVRKRQRHALQGLSEHMLKDIGISRCDVFRESSKFFWHE